ncbi:MAG: TOBE domain-containing protein [Alphaproteobacteria bacterium]|nr:TOBE domain-containing protein [Alphaproteobacteria bacterium]
MNLFEGSARRELALPPGVAALAVRPEKLMLSAARPEGFALAATVSALNYQGGVSLVHMTTEWGQPLKARLPSAAAAAFSRGATVWASWDPADAVALSR